MRARSRYPMPIARNPEAFRPEPRERRRRLAEDPKGRRREVGPLPDGYALRFAPDPPTPSRVMPWVSPERPCRPLPRFSLEIAGTGGPAWLRISGREWGSRWGADGMGLGADPA